MLASAHAEATSPKIIAHYRAGVISDTHFGKMKTNAALLFEFLTHHSFDTLYLNGDFFDGWKLESNKYREMPEMQCRVIDRICELAAGGTRVVYIPGNHDEKLRVLFNKEALKKSVIPLECSTEIDGGRLFKFSVGDKTIPIEVLPHDIFEADDGQKYLIIHGDQMDPPWLKTKEGISFAKFLDQAFHEWPASLFTQDNLPIDKGILKKLRKKKKNKKFSLSKYLKSKVDQRQEVTEAFDKGAAKLAVLHQVDGVVSGHIHHLHEKMVDVFSGLDMQDLREIFQSKGKGDLNQLLHEFDSETLDKYIGDIVDRFAEHVHCMNCGDWEEHAGMAVFGSGDERRLVDWEVERQNYPFLNAIPTPDQSNPVVGFRPVSEEILDWVQDIWPAHNLEKWRKNHPEHPGKLYPARSNESVANTGVSID